MRDHIQREVYLHRSNVLFSSSHRWSCGGTSCLIAVRWRLWGPVSAGRRKNENSLPAAPLWGASWIRRWWGTCCPPRATCGLPPVCALCVLHAGPLRTGGTMGWWGFRGWSEACASPFLSLSLSYSVWGPPPAPNPRTCWGSCTGRSGSDRKWDRDRE